MKYGVNGNMWITWNYKEAEKEANHIFNAVVGSESVSEVCSRLETLGLEHADTRYVGVSEEFLYANNIDLVSVYLFHGEQVSVSIRKHDLGSPHNLKRFWNSFYNIGNMTAMERQE